MPRSPSIPTSRATFISNPSERALAAWHSGHTRLQESTSSNISYVENERKPLSRGDQGEVTGPGHGERGFSPVCAPRPGLGHRGRKDAGLPGGVPASPGTRQATQTGPQGHMQGSLGQSTALRCGLGQVLGKGAPSPISLSCTPAPDFWGWRRKTLMESRSFVAFSSFRARCWRPLRGDPLAEGWTDAWRGGGSTIGRPNQASRQTDEGNNIITPRTPWGRYSKYHIK